MAKNVINGTNAGQKKLVCCRDCFWAMLMRYENNPVLAECMKKPDFNSRKFPFERDVASRMKYCDMHKHQDESEKFIQPRIIERHHPMAAYVRTNDVKGAEAAA